MAIEKQIVPLSLGIGIDTKSDPKQVVPTKLLELENALFGTSNEYTKRYGYNSLNSISAGNAIGSFNNQLVALNGTGVSTYSSNLNSFSDPFPGLNKKTCLSIDKNIITARALSYTNPDMAYTNGYYAFIQKQISSSTLSISIIDSTTGKQILVNNAAIGATSVKDELRVSVLGTKFIFSYGTTAGNLLRYFYVDTTAPTVISAPVTLANNYASTSYDCRTVGTNLIFVYATTTNQTSAFALSSTLVQGATFTVAVDSDTIGIFSDTTNNVWVGRGLKTGAGPDVSQVGYFILNPTITATVLGNTSIDAAVSGIVPNISGIYNGTNGQFFYQVTDTTLPTNYQNNYTKKATMSVAGATISAAVVMIRSAGLYSRPFYNGTTIYMAVSHYSALQSMYFLVDETGHAAAKWSIGLAYNNAFNKMPVSVYLESGSKYSLPISEYDTTSEAGGTFFNQAIISQLILNFDDPTVIQNLGNNLEMSGGVLSIFDGTVTSEQGFNIFPESITAVVNGAASGSMDAGTYQYSVCYEWTDSQSQVHRSAPSAGLTVVVGAGTNSVTLTLPTLRVTDKSGVLIVVYRTEASGLIFYQVTPSPAFGSAVFNDPSVNSVTFTDTLADASIIGNNQLYTNGGELENIASPASDITWTYKSRMMCVYSENRKQFGYSKQVIPGVPVEFTDTFFSNIPEFGGNITAGIQMDDKNIIFKRNTIYYQVGDGPSPNGQNNDFTTPQLISSDTGCIDKKSVVLMPLGVMFKSSKGIYLLDRSLQIKYIGNNVEAYNNATVRSAIMIQGVNQVRFTLSSGIVLMYDYFNDDWSVFTNIDAVDACLFQNIYTYIKLSGSVFQESIGSFTDNGALIAMKLKTAWFQFKIQGFQRASRLFILGDYKSPHTLQIDISINFDPAIVQTITIPVLTSITPYQLRSILRFQKCESFQLTITELQSPAYGQGLTLSAITFEVGVKKGPMKVPSAATYG